MKIVVSAVAPSLDAQVEPRFGRAPYFILVDADTMSLLEAIENPFTAQASGVGIQVAQLVLDKGAQAVITGNVGPKAFQALATADIPVITGVSGTVKEVVEQFKQGKLSPTSSATSPAHSGGGWGRGMGRGMGMGMGMGMGRGMYGGGGRGMSSPMPGMGSGNSAEIETLKQQVNKMQQMLEGIWEKLDALEKKGK